MHARQSRLCLPCRAFGGGAFIVQFCYVNEYLSQRRMDALSEWLMMIAIILDKQSGHICDIRRPYLLRKDPRGH